MSTNEARRELIEKCWAAAWGEGEIDVLDALLDPRYRRISGRDVAAGQDRAELKASITATRSAFPDLTTTIDDIVLEGDRAAVRWHSTGTHRDRLLGVPATHRRVEVSGATFARFEREKIVEEFVTWDPRALLSALGIITVGQDS